MRLLLLVYRLAKSPLLLMTARNATHCTDHTMRCSAWPMEGKRSADVERCSSSIAAPDLATAKLRSTFLIVHYDLWKMDVPAQPSLVDLGTDHGMVPTLVPREARRCPRA